jgi:hypothetical protein
MACATLGASPLSLAAQTSDAFQVAGRPAQPFRPVELPVRTAAPTAKPHLQREDRAYVLVGGEWNCKTFAGTVFKRRYSRDEDALSIVAETVVQIGGRTGKLLEVYRNHRSARKWVATLAGGQIVAVASPWRKGEWIFGGFDSTTPGHNIRIRMTYRSYGINSFRREFDHLYNGHFVPYAGERCEREPILRHLFNVPVGPRDDSRAFAVPVG